MIERALKAGTPFAWVAANHHFGSWSGKPPVAGTALEIAQGLDPSAWRRLSAGEGTKGARLHEWAYCELADLDAAEYDETRSGVWTKGLLIRRHIADGDLAFFSTWCPAGTDIAMLVCVEGHRWAIEDSFETAKTQPLDHNETRSWHGWHRHASLVMLAFAMMVAIRHRANTMPTQQTRPQILVGRRLSAGPFRKSAAHRKPARTAAHRQASNHRLVALAMSPSGRCKASPSKTEENEPEKRQAIEAEIFAQKALACVGQPPLLSSDRDFPRRELGYCPAVGIPQGEQDRAHKELVPTRTYRRSEPKCALPQGLSIAAHGWFT